MLQTAYLKKPPQFCTAAERQFVPRLSESHAPQQANEILSVHAPDQNCCNLPSSDVFPDILRLFSFETDMASIPDFISFFLNYNLLLFIWHDNKVISSSSVISFSGYSKWDIRTAHKLLASRLFYRTTIDNRTSKVELVIAPNFFCLQHWLCCLFCSSSL